jgi:transcriptional regulator with XRE-family HTH domain
VATEFELGPASDPTSSTLAFFGAELRLQREAAGLSQTQLAKCVHCAPSLLSRIESATRVPQEDLAGRLDDALGTEGLFTRLWPVMIRNAFPAWFRPYVQLEEQATTIQSFENLLVPGLLQTEAYARALFAGGRLDTVEEVVFARMHRQRILTREEPPLLWAILDANALRRDIGGTAVMRAQLIRLIEAAQAPRVVMQVIPGSVGPRPALMGSFNTLSFGEGPDVLLQHGFYRDQLMGEPEAVAAAHHAYDLLRAVALSPEESIGLITDQLKELP